MDYLDLTLPSFEANLALDEALLLEAEARAAPEVLRLWEWPTPAVVLGAGCRLADDVLEEACLQDRVPVGRRASGGGTVLLGRGCLCYSLVLAYRRDTALREIGSSYAYILERVAGILRDVVPGAAAAGTSDLAAAGSKFSGNAQQRKRDHLLHHGTLLYDFDLDAVSRYLRSPARQPEYRQGREHAAFLCNLAFPGQELRHRLRTIWQAETEYEPWPAEIVRQLVVTKYGQPEWVGRR